MRQEKNFCCNANRPFPNLNDRIHFELLTLETMQCGLNWRMVLRKRNVISFCFDHFDFHKIAGYPAEKIEDILRTEGMIKNSRKTKAVVTNAIQFLKIIEEFGSFDSYIWKFTEDIFADDASISHKYCKPYINSSSVRELSDRISRDLKKRGFQFTGPITVYSYLQACGIIHDPGRICFLDEVTKGSIT